MNINELDLITIKVDIYLVRRPLVIACMMKHQSDPTSVTGQDRLQDIAPRSSNQILLVTTSSANESSRFFGV